MTLTTVTSRATAAIVAAVAGFASYRHIYDVAITHGEHRTVAAVLPLAIDGLILVATLAMLDDKRQQRHPRLSARVAMAFGILATLAANIASAQPSTAARLVAAVPAISFMLAVEVLSRTGRPAETGNKPLLVSPSEPVAEPVAQLTTSCKLPGSRRGAVAEPDQRDLAAVNGFTAQPVAEPVRQGERTDLLNNIKKVIDLPEPVREPVAEPVRTRVTPRSLTTAARVTAAHSKHPDATHDRLAELAGVSVATIKRHRPPRTVTSSPSGPHAAETRVNGSPVEVLS